MSGPGKALSRRSEQVTEGIASSLLTLARVVTQVRTHESMCRQAGVDLDRAGAALVYKLYSEGDGVRFTDLAERLGIDSPAVTRKVRQLEAEGLVERSTDPSDGRAVRLTLTDAGRKSIERLLRARQRWFDDILQEWSEDDRRHLARLLALLATTIAHQENGHHGA